MTDNAPNVYQVSPLQRISFSNYVNMKECILKGLPSYCLKYYGEFKYSGQSSGKILGNLFHHLLKNIDNLSGLDRKKAALVMKDVLANYLDHIENLNAQRDSRIIKKLRCSKIIEEIYTTVWMVYIKASNEVGNYCREINLESTDHSVHGILDELYLTPECVSIVDYKTSHDLAVLGSTNNIDQLHLYSYLVYENYGMFPTQLKIVGLLGIEIEVELNVDLLEAYSEKIKEFRYQSNCRIELNDLDLLCAPNESNCFNCYRKIICPKMDNHRYQKYLPKNKKILKVEIVEMQANSGGWKGRVISGCIQRNKVVSISSTGGVDLNFQGFYLGDNVLLDEISFVHDSVLISKDTGLYLLGGFDK